MPFSFTKLRTTENNSLSQIENTEDRVEEIASHINTNFAVNIPIPQVADLENMAPLLNATKSAFLYNHILRSNAELENDQGAGAANQLFTSDGDGTTNFTFGFRSNVDINHTDGNGSAGQVLQSDGDGTTSWISIAVSAEQTTQNANFLASDNARISVDTTGGAINCTSFLMDSVTKEFSIQPTEDSDFETNPVTVVRNAAESIANDANDFLCDVNAVYTFRGSASGNVTVAVEPLLRST